MGRRAVATSSAASNTMVMMRLPPGVPSTTTAASVSRNAGVILDSGRLPAAIALALEPVRP